MIYLEKESGRRECQSGKNGAAFVILTDENGNPKGSEPVTVNVPPPVPATQVVRIETSAASTNLKFVKAGPTTILTIDAMNASDKPKYLRLYDKASLPNVGVEVAKLVFCMPAGQKFQINIGNAGIKFTSGLSIAITGDSSITDNTTLLVGDVLSFNLIYV